MGNENMQILDLVDSLPPDQVIAFHDVSRGGKH